MNILTDVLSLIKRSVYAKKAGLNDVLIIGTNEQPDMEGVASPIPYKSVKVIKVRDFKVAAEHCAHANSPASPAAGTGQVYQKTESDDVLETCTVFYRSLKSLSSNLTLANSADDDYVEITTTGEPNTAANVGSGFAIWKDKVGETLNFRSLVGGTNVTLSQSANEITINSPQPYNAYVAKLSAASGAGGGTPTISLLANNTGLTIAWARSGVGEYDATISGGVAPENKVWFTASGGGGNDYQKISWGTETELTLQNYDGNTGVAAEGLNEVYIEIRIYS